MDRAAGEVEALDAGRASWALEGGEGAVIGAAVEGSAASGEFFFEVRRCGDDSVVGLDLELA